ncbi:MAG TPA: RidA family protein, partial [Candidatus Binatia bacterium]|nr:RidA family protein [Candidatus Binatia bacterium]
MLVDNPPGNFQFLKGIGPFSSGVVAHPGYEVVHVTFHPLPPLQRGFELVERHLQRNQRPLKALCGMELRIPQSLSRQAFNEFNQPYIN